MQSSLNVEDDEKSKDELSSNATNGSDVRDAKFYKNAFLCLGKLGDRHPNLHTEKEIYHIKTMFSFVRKLERIQRARVLRSTKLEPKAKAKPETH